MRTTIVLAFLLPAGIAAAQTSVQNLAKPPAAALHFTVMSTAGRHGDSARWTTSDGIRMGRESFVLRGQVFETDSASHVGSDGMLDRVAIRGFTPNGDAAESFAIAGGRATWKSPVDGGSMAYTAPAEYTAFGGPIDLTAELAERLIASPDRSLALLPAGRVRAEPLGTAVVGGAPGITVTAYAITGLSNTPIPVWVDDSGRFFGAVGALSWIRSGFEAQEPKLQQIQDDALAKRSPAVAKALLKTPSGPVAFTHVRAFLAGDHFAENQTIVVERGVVTQAGAAARVTVPPGAQIIDGKGETLVPGLWESHMHFQDDASGPALLSLGVTSVRDPGNNNSLTLTRAARRARGELLSPRVYASVLIDGKGPNTAQVASVATSQDEALAITRKAKSEGFVAIKLYGTFNPAWVRATAAEAHRLGLHVHGHLPAGMRSSQAIDDGYDEITHIYFVMMQAMPDDVVAKSNGMARFLGPGEYAKDVKLDAEPMKSLIAKMAQRKITVDPTLVVAEGLYVPENGDLSPAYAPFVGTLPPAVERGFRQGGFVMPPGVTRADFRASFAHGSERVGGLPKASWTRTRCAPPAASRASRRSWTKPGGSLYASSGQTRLVVRLPCD
jgi:hypothetical protein